jgi:16S rRNA (cytosine967-C5)-methyltransferase
MSDRRARGPRPRTRTGSAARGGNAPGSGRRAQPDPGRRARPDRTPDPARRAALDLLRAVHERGAYANLTLPGLLRERRLAGRDAAFATELGYGTLRATGTLDAVLGACSDRPLAEVDADVRDVLRLGGYQLLRTRVPAHAAVAATVDLAPGRATGFVNAVLRRVARLDWDGWIAELAPPGRTDPVRQLALRYAHPEWVVEAFRDALGGDWAETGEALAGDDARPETHLVAWPGRIDRDTLAAEVDGVPGPWSPYAVRLASGGDPGRLPAVRSGRAGVQDEGSQLCALALIEALPREGRRQAEWWLDLCAGPGGKAAVLGGLAAGLSARLLAVEIAGHRARLVRSATAGLPVTVVRADSTVPAWGRGRFDRVLVDAPCSGLGALRRRPEARWRRRPSELTSLVRLQRALLAGGVEAVRPGGLIGYVTCSPHLAETRAVVAEAVRRHPVEQLDARPLFPGVADLGAGPHVQLWPHRHGTDAMFFALLRRTG